MVGHEHSSDKPETPPLLEVALGESSVHIQNLPEIIEASREQPALVHSQVYADGPIQGTLVTVHPGSNQGPEWRGSIQFQRRLMQRAYQDRLMDGLFGKDSMDTGDLSTSFLRLRDSDSVIGSIKSNRHEFYAFFSADRSRGFEDLNILGPFGSTRGNGPGEEPLGEAEQLDLAAAFARAFLLAARLSNGMKIKPEAPLLVIRGHTPSLAPEIGYLALGDLPKRLIGKDKLAPTDLQSVLEFSYQPEPDHTPMPRPKKPEMPKREKPPTPPPTLEAAPAENPKPALPPEIPGTGVVYPDEGHERPPERHIEPDAGIIYPDKVQEKPPQRYPNKHITNGLDQVEPRFRLDEVGGLAHIKEEIRKIAVEFSSPETMQKWNANSAQGVLFYGEPGTGKTMLAHALAHETQSALWVLDSASLYDQWLSVSARNMKNVFNSIRSYSGNLVVLIDEIDSIIGIAENPGPGGADSERNQVAGVFKEELNALAATNPNVLIVGTTNNLDRIEPALIRSGRFDYRLEVPLPDDEARNQIVTTILASNMQEAGRNPDLYGLDLDVPEIVQVTDGMNGADINEIFARVRRDKAVHEVRFGEVKPVTQADIIQKIDEFKQMG